MKKYVFLGIMLWIQSGIVSAQEPSGSDATRDTTLKVLQADPVRDFQDVSLRTAAEKDSLTLGDHQHAAAYDSLWLEELRQLNQRFDEMYREVQTAATDSLPSVEMNLDKDVLK